MSGVEVFKRLLPLAAALNLRLVIVNRRDYPGSSLYEGEELDIIKEDNITGNDGFGRRQAGELARFIKTFIEKEDVPKPSSDGKDGGVVLLSWSSGNGYTLPLLAYPDAIPEGTREVIAPYLRLHIMFGASIKHDYCAIGCSDEVRQMRRAGFSESHLFHNKPILSN